MCRLSILIFFFIILFHSSCEQATKVKSPKATFITKTLGSKDGLLTDSVFLNQLAKIYGDSVSIIVDQLLKDTSFHQLSDTSSDDGEFASSAYKIQFPIRPVGWTNDFENIFSAKQIFELDSIISKFQTETTIEIAIVTLDGSWTSTEKFDRLILTIHNDWGVGKKNINNGIVIGMSTGLKRIRISNGFGIEKKLSDSATKEIIDHVIIPAFKQAEFFKGTKEGLLALMEKIRHPVVR